MGERKNSQGTQVDVLFTVSDRQGTPVGHVLVEVKLSENEFGGCRGANPKRPGRAGNPWPDRCLDVGEIMASPGDRCWIVETEGRRYWERMALETSSFLLNRIRTNAPCPFRHGLYQLMRNRVLADALVQETSAKWADVATCIHPENDEARQLTEAVCGDRDAGRAFLQITKAGSLLELDPVTVVAITQEQNSKQSGWADWMRARYWPDQAERH